jgi:acetyl-CoA carboxylase carboxyl transferase subunit beta
MSANGHGTVSTENAAAAEDQPCLDCGALLADSLTYQRYRVCDECRYHYYLPARQRIDLLTDADTFREMNESLVPLDPLSFVDNVPYRERLGRAQQVTGLVEAVVTGTGYIGGMPAVLGVLDFGFMGGSIGSAVGEKITLAVEAAVEKRLPFLLVVCGGGPRMQEGILSLMQLAKTASAMKKLTRRGIPFISVLASPSTGQLYATAAGMADIIIAEPGALIGFAPLRDAKEATGKPVPKDFQTAEFHIEHGAIDGIVDRQSLKQRLALLLDLLTFRYRLTLQNRTRLHPVHQVEAPAWDRVQKARHQHRPTSRDYIERIVSNFVELHGDRVFGDDPAIVAGMGYVAGEAVMVIGQERGRGEDAACAHQGRVFPEGFRKAERAMRLAAKFKLPVVTFIDTPGAYQGLEAEERGIGGAISSAISAVSDLKTPVLAVIIGQGGSEAALALGMADRVLMLENAICAPTTPEDAAWVLYRDPERADEVASALKLTAPDCVRLGVADAIVPEPEDGAHTDFDGAAREVERMLVQSLLDVQMTFNRTLLRDRLQRFRRIGIYGTSFQATLATEALHVQDLLRRGLRRVKDRLQGSVPQAGESPPHGVPQAGESPPHGVPQVGESTPQGQARRG